MKKKEVTILMVEDDDADIEAAKRAFDKARLGNLVVFASDGVEALEYLRGVDGAEPKVRRPYVVMTDLNMPRMDGLELLTTLRADPKLADSIVFVLTTSAADRDRWAAYDKNVAGYILKDNVGRDFFKLIAMIDHYKTVVEFPLDRN